MMAMKLLSKLRNQNLQITGNRNHHRVLNATRLFSDQPVSSLSTPDNDNNNNNNSKVIIIKNKPQTTTSSLKQNELAKFAAISDTWWDSEGPFKPLHIMNPTRLAFIRSMLCRHFSKDPNFARPFEGLKFVDVGCGGGILSEPLARMGATVTGVDAVEKNINVARLHAEGPSRVEKHSFFIPFSCEEAKSQSAQKDNIACKDLDPVTSTIEYCCTTAEKLVEEQRKFDAVIALEVIEHVANPAEFCKSLAALTYRDGVTVLSTINRSMRAYATAIGGRVLSPLAS